jgi:hypothetical protein
MHKASEQHAFAPNVAPLDPRVAPYLCAQDFIEQLLHALRGLLILKNLCSRFLIQLIYCLVSVLMNGPYSSAD